MVWTSLYFRPKIFFHPAPLITSLALVMMACHTPHTSRLSTTEASTVRQDNAGLDAILHGDNEALGLFLSAGGDPNMRNEAGMGALHFAAVRGNATAVKLLVQAGARLGAAAGGPAPLHMAAQGGDVGIVSYLIDQGADVNEIWELNGHTPLLEASFDARVDVVRYLLSRGADAGAVTLRGLSASDLADREADRNPDMKTILGLLNEHNRGLGWPNDNRGRYDASVGAKNQRLVALLDRIDPIKPLKPAEQRQAQLQADLLDAAEKGNLALVRQWVEQGGADVNAISGRLGTTPLILASVAGHADVVDYLLVHGADANIHEKHPMGISALFKGAVFGQTAIVKALLDKGAFVNEQGPANGMSPLHDAVFRGRLDVAKLLIRYGANPDLEDYTGRTPRDLARARGEEDLIFGDKQP